MWRQFKFSVGSRGRGTYDITREINGRLLQAGITTGLAHVFVHHTSASLILCENADPAVRRDLETFMAHAVPDGDPMFEHISEGPDDMPAHVRSVLTQNGLTIPISDGRLALGAWQGIYLWEHRRQSHKRSVTVTFHGDKT